MAETSFSSGLIAPAPAASPFAPEGNLPKRDAEGKSRRKDRAATKDRSGHDDGEDLEQEPEHELDRLA